MNKLKWLVGLLVVLSILAVLANISPKENKNGATSKPTPTKIKENVSVYETEYFYFEYPKKYSLTNVPARDGRVYTNVDFEGNKENVLKLSLLFRESTQDLNELTDVKMRRMNSYQYSEEVARIGEDIRGLLFRTADRKERVAYFMKKGRLLTVTMITVGPYTDEIESEFQGILKSAVWK